ncbi:SixA phosphatase family protein [Stakelama marina]|uniref:Histidine phosphatase family protein n=1 Tax=Stakelama marina TaxID=2826939 RepID=A0A8T4IGE2_9SPHN|nr:histidine phosphatase family protein [Stakelama marina]MBR0552944.1 histidine phosphatase family protein [Stakelama marina]
MKTLILLRHAKSGWDDPVARDFDRPLNPKGERAATTMGRHLRNLGLRFDQIVASPALRVSQTLDHFAEGYGRSSPTMTDRRVYLASCATLIDIVRELDDNLARVLIVGHNPGLEELALALSEIGKSEARAAIEEKFPTASVAELRFDVDHWADVAPATGHIETFVRPRDLDAALGPDII